jgi:hypothetical protein
MEARAHTLDGELWRKLVRRAQLIAAHQRFYGLRIDAREVARRALASQPDASIVQYRALLEEAVASFLHGFR